jgi:hypothetical protein
VGRDLEHNVGCQGTDRDEGDRAVQGLGGDPAARGEDEPVGAGQTNPDGHRQGHKGEHAGVEQEEGQHPAGEVASKTGAQGTDHDRRAR